MSLEPKQFSDDLRSLDFEKIQALTDDEIYNYLRNEIGISIGPLVSSTRELYEKILIDLVHNLDNADEFLNNFTKIGDEPTRSTTEKNKTNDSGHGYSINNDITSIESNNSTVNGQNNDQRIGEIDFIPSINSNNNASLSTKSNLSTLSTKSNVSTKSNLSTKSNGTSKSNSDVRQNNLLNFVCKSSEPISSPIPSINVIDESDTIVYNVLPDDTNNIQSQQNQQLNKLTNFNNQTKCSTPIDRQTTKINQFDLKRIHTLNDNSSSLPISSLTNNIATINNFSNTNSDLTKTATNNIRNVFKSSNNRPLTEFGLNRNLESRFKTARNNQQTAFTARSIASNRSTTTNQTAKQNSSNNDPQLNINNQQSSNSLQFSDKEDDEEGETEGGVSYGYKVNESNQFNRRSRLTGGIRQRIPTKFSKNEYLKRTAPNYQTNHPPQTTSLSKHLLLLILALLIFSIVLAITSYF